jgi:hypothetical protein
MLADIGPYSSFTKLKKEVKKEKYNGVKLDGITD